ncbi:MAG: hypothetical protein ABW164_09260 [Sphingobium sp.]
MNDYPTRGEISPVDRASVRAPVPLSAVQPAGDAARDVDRRAAPRASAAPAGAAVVDDDAVSAADYARVRARIADILADLRAQGRASDLTQAQGAIDAMLPQPLLLVPLPPASKDAVEFAAGLARKIAEQASHALAAQAHLPRGGVDGLLSHG